MGKLTKFIEDNVDSLDDSEISAITAGIYMQNELLKVQISEMESKPRSETTMSDMMNYFDFGLLFMRQKGRCYAEKDCGDMLVLLWDYLMHDYNLVGREVALPSKNRIDILAELDGEGVVIELKCADAGLESKAPEQVGGYVKEISALYGKPYDHLIINNTGACSDIANVMTWSELGIYKDFAHVPDSFDVSELAEICEALNIYPKVIDGKRAYRYDVIFDYIHGGL